MIRPNQMRKREPVDWRHYATYVRRAERKLGRRRHPFAATVIGSIVFAIAGALFAQAIGVGLAAGMRDLGSSIVSSLPGTLEEDLVLGEAPVTISIAPIFEDLPEFLKGDQLIFEGRVPVFAVRSSSAISVSLNGKPVTVLSVGADGRFGPIPITLQDGANTVEATLLDGVNRIASTSHTVTVDRVAPELKIVRPEANATVEGEVIVEGQTEAAADVTVNGMIVRPNPDGSFTERIVAPPGPLALTIVVTDRAGNETKTEMSITVAEAKAPAAGLSLAISLDRALVKPGETIVAEIHALQDGQLRADLPFTVQVGLITIGSYRTDANGMARVAFAAPKAEYDEVAVVVLGGGTSARATFAVAKQSAPEPSKTPAPRRP